MTRLGYFGKLPACGDFVRCCDNPVLVQLLDAWLAQLMHALTAAPRWKLQYDAMAPLRFAFVGRHSRRAIAGRLEASGDQSQRRFPFIVMSELAIADAGAFVPCSPLALAPLWQRMEQLAGGVVASSDPAPLLQALAAATVPLTPGDASHAAQFDDFLQAYSMGQWQALLATPAFPVTLCELLLGLGLLLQPVRASGCPRLEKSLVLPLPRERRLQELAASFWLHLILPFLCGRDVELALYFTRLNDAPVLAIGLGGADPHTLQALIDPQSDGQRLVVLDRLDWVEAQLMSQPRLRQLAACLQQPQLSLRAACALFFDAFA